MFEWDNEEDTSNTLLAIKKVIKPPGLYKNRNDDFGDSKG